ncbi:macrophomate synthase [Corynespora cassiicola Philippines]|uniref:Macrophomate synthase n=1 Tax=Corynespora cassiicola Philippines TaxID=1448308 RepID=A0A2T2NY37_CORCC|nr:macrophomate synthase [Corynespora cassiicola Philippines]
MQQYRATSLFQPSNLAYAMRNTMDPSKGPSHLFGSIMAFPHTMVARTIAVLGMDYVMVDALHTEGRTVAIVRVPSAHSDLLTHALDAGAAGIVFPHIDTPEQAAEAVSKCRYATSGGDRSLSPCALVPGITDTAPHGSTHDRVADSHIAVICQIESQLALDNSDAICATQGVDCLMLGPGDLRLSLGLPARKFGERDDPRFLAAIDRLVAVKKRHQKPLMVVSFKVSAEQDSWLQNFNLLLSTADFVDVVKGHQNSLVTIKNILAGFEKDQTSAIEATKKLSERCDSHENLSQALG